MNKKNNKCFQYTVTVKLRGNKKISAKNNKNNKKKTFHK